MTVVPALLNTKCVPLLPDMPLPMAVLPPKVRVELVPLTVLLMVVVPLKVNVEPVPLTLPLPGSELSPIVVSPLNVIDRKSVGQGNRGAERVDLGGSRILKQTKIERQR